MQRHMLLFTHIGLVDASVGRLPSRRTHPGHDERANPRQHSASLRNVGTTSRPRRSRVSPPAASHTVLTASNAITWLWSSPTMLEMHARPRLNDRPRANARAMRQLRLWSVERREGTSSPAFRPFGEVKRRARDMFFHCALADAELAGDFAIFQTFDAMHEEHLRVRGVSLASPSFTRSRRARATTTSSCSGASLAISIARSSCSWGRTPSWRLTSMPILTAVRTRKACGF